MSSTTGLLVDWLALLDPETITTHPQLQFNLLFSAKTKPSQTATCQPASKSGNCQPYLLSLLVHHSNWDTLRHCVNLLLNDEESVQRYESDFVHKIYRKKVSVETHELKLCPFLDNLLKKTL
jgi:hypothetical protein